MFGGKTSQIHIQTQHKLTQIMFIYTWVTVSIYKYLCILVIEQSLQNIVIWVVFLLYWNSSCLETQLHKYLSNLYINAYRSFIYIHHWLCIFICVLLFWFVRYNRNEHQKHWVKCTLPVIFKLKLFGGTTSQIHIQTQHQLTQIMFIYTWLTVSSYMYVANLVIKK